MIAYSSLKIITQGDLKPLTNLENLHIDNNQLEMLDKDLFLSNPAIQIINLSQNKIKLVALDVLEPLAQLKHLSMLENICIDRSSEN